MKRFALAALLVCVHTSSAGAQDPSFHANLRDNILVPGTNYADMWAEGVTGLVGGFGVAFVDLVDISDPDNLSITTAYAIPPPNDCVSAQDVKSGYSPIDPFTPLLFVALEGGGTDGVLIVDITNAGNPIALTTLNPAGALGAYTFVHNMSYRSDGWLAICNGTGVAIIDLTNYDPFTAPAAINTLTYELTNLGTGIVHDMTFSDDRLYVSEWDTLMVFDASDLANSPPTLLGQISGMSSHAVWPTADGTYAITAEERTGGAVRLFEIVASNDNSFDLYQTDSFVNPLTGTGESFTAHNVVVLGDRVYVSNYQAGVLVLQIDRSSKTMEKVASYDTSTSPGFGFTGCFGVYPLQGHEMVLASDISQGIFMLDFSSLQIRFTSPRPKTVLALTPHTISVEVDELGFEFLQKVELFWRVEGGAFTPTAMTNTSGITWEADLPVAGCGSRIDYYVAATGADVFTSPANAPTSCHAAYATVGLVPVFTDDFETDKGWTVTDISLSDGSWVRGVPVESGAQPGNGDPEAAGMSCYITANGPVGGSTSRADVDGGPTQLESPDLDFSAGDGLISYKCWAFNDNADLNDGLVVEVSNDGGMSWTMVDDMIEKAGGWLERCFRLSDHVAPSASVRVRFSIADNPNDSVTDCMKDFDGDDFGDVSPPAGVVPGTDCDDSNAGLTPLTDTDGDSIGDCNDSDDDNDGVADGSDPLPLDPDVCGDVDENPVVRPRR